MRAELLHVIGCYFNHRRNPHLLRNARTWLERTQDAGVKVTSSSTSSVRGRSSSILPRTRM